MIAYKIIVENLRDNIAAIKPPVVNVTDKNYRDVVLQRNLNICQYKINDRVKIRRTARRGTVEKIVNVVDDVNWVQNQPHFIQVKFDDGIVMMCRLNQLKRSKI